MTEPLALLVQLAALAALWMALPLVLVPLGLLLAMVAGVGRRRETHRPVLDPHQVATLHPADDELQVQLRPTGEVTLAA